jgi:hypothetical protein
MSVVRSKKGWESATVAFAVGAVIAFCGFGGWAVWVLDRALSTEVTDRTSDWATFYESDVKGLFTIPPEAEVVSAKETSEFLGGGFEVRFRLPTSRAAEEWTRQIAEDSGLEGHKITDHLYDAGHIASERMGRKKLGDTYELRYDAVSRTYVATWAWD